MSKSRITIKDLARELNISTSTVSRALADKWDVNPETRKAVLELAEKMNYHPNPISLSLKQSQTMSIGVIVPEFVNSFFAEVIMGIQSVMNAKGYHILISQSNESADIELINLKAMEDKMVDGIIISVTQDTKVAEYLKSLNERNLPIVFFNRIAPEVSASNVIIDDYKWAFTAVEHLIAEGYRRIAHLSGPENLFLSKERKRGYVDALKKHGYPIEEELMIPSGILMESGITAAYTILEMENKPDAVFAVNDPAAIGAMKTLQKKGMIVPDDIAFVGFSESQKALIIEPNLTSVEQPTFEMGKVTAELLLEQIKKSPDESRPSKTIILEAQLNIRESSKKKVTPPPPM